MNSYEIKNMIIDTGFQSEEYVTTEFTYNSQTYSVTFQKGDLELMNAWVFKEGSSIPANLSEEMINAIREDVKKRI
ncbi:hypothetical protein H1D32_09850 [Anaerobacillus sp. CMMVII]|uniref:hypothetical protein n=1 Tax=Anaerobacillus sp. CMMVII TaxID=2755588 RepID=UPI0021B7CC89|nr:hypothetical protein [Anaerobacillus sp. CMMVII]MCT8138033.1 hypothetical protein [Anaerobacillus sp. CMMVII]